MKDDLNNFFFPMNSIYIHGFHMRCQPLIAVESSQMSGSYSGALLNATAFYANYGMLPLVFGVVS